MTTYSFRSSRPDSWASPRAYSDPTLRRMHYGPILPMRDERRGLIAKLLRAN